MEFVCNYDNGKGDPYVLTLDRKPLRWRCKDSCNVGIQDEDGVMHTVIFNFQYQAALYIHFIDYNFNDEDNLPKHIACEIGQCFRTDIWNPNADKTGYAFVLWTLKANGPLDYESFRKKIRERASIRRHKNILLPHDTRLEPYATGIDHDFRFLYYVIHAMEDVGHIKLSKGKIELTGKKGGP